MIQQKIVSGDRIQVPRFKNLILSTHGIWQIQCVRLRDSIPNCLKSFQCSFAGTSTTCEVWHIKNLLAELFGWRFLFIYGHDKLIINIDITLIVLIIPTFISMIPYIDIIISSISIISTFILIAVIIVSLCIVPTGLVQQHREGWERRPLGSCLWRVPRRIDQDPVIFKHGNRLPGPSDHWKWAPDGIQNGNSLSWNTNFLAVVAAIS